ncbi:MAG: hypothetical protein F9K25_16480 [Candidatus Contendobacter sp.]|nr:MAG: hypothetical protein F9K25_16480 [Candidatus Contendobacter sp.]
MTLAVKRYTSTQTGAPTLNGTAGSLVTLLDACLKDGFNSQSISSATQTGGTATVTFSGAHGYAVNDVIAISGANEAAWNDEFRVLTVADSTHLTFAIDSGTTSPATGTLSAMIAPLGWTKPFSGTNKAAYLPQAQYVQSYLRVLDDSSTPTSANGRWAKLRGYETMSDVDTGTGPFPDTTQAANALTCWKSSTSDSTARPWWLVGDGGIFYLGIAALASQPGVYGGYAFGDINSLKSGDGYSSLLSAWQAGVDTLPSVYGTPMAFATLVAYTATQVGKYLARTYTQLGTAVACGFMGDNGVYTVMGGSGPTYPHPPDNGLLFAPVAVVEGSVIRSRALPGLYTPLHANPLALLATVTDVPDLPSRTLQCFGLVTGNTNAAQCLIDITGPWR